jgi:hypothetical protein
MTQEVKNPTDPISRGEAIILLRWLVDTMHKPSPKGGFYSLLHRTPQEVAEMYSTTELTITDTAIINAMRRKIAETV